MDIFSIIEKTEPTFDKLDKFIFFYNYKASSSSFQDVKRGLCKNRVIRKKQHTKMWYQKFEQYTEYDIKNMFKFSIVRNPWARLVSAHNYFTKSVPREVKVPIDFEKFVKSTLYNIDKKTLIYPTYTQKFEAHIGFQCPRVVLTDYVAKMENLDKEFKYIQEKIGIIKNLPHINSTGSYDYRSYYTTELKNIVGDFYAKDISILGYTF